MSALRPPPLVLWDFGRKTVISSTGIVVHQTPLESAPVLIMMAKHAATGCDPASSPGQYGRRPRSEWAGWLAKVEWLQQICSRLQTVIRRGMIQYSTVQYIEFKLIQSSSPAVYVSWSDRDNGTLVTACLHVKPGGHSQSFLIVTGSEQVF